MIKFRSIMLGAAAAGLLFGASMAAKSAQAQTKEYKIALLSDFSGPYADIMPILARSREAVLEWWNRERGAKLGVKLSYKNFDTRYDAAQVASLWPGIRSELNPIAVMGLGGPDVAALGQRLPDDGVPMFMATAGYGFSWKAGSWIFNPRATYAHEHAGFFKWMKEKRGGSAPLKIAIIASEASPAYIDIARGIEKYAKDNPSEIELVEIIFTEVQPTDITTQVRRVVRAGVEVITIQTNTAAVVATKRALQALGSDVRIVTSSHNGLPASGKAAGGMDQFEGDFEAYGMAIASAEKSEPYKFYEMLKSTQDYNVPWNVITVMGLSQALYTARAIENTIVEHGAGNLTGEKVRETLFKMPIKTEDTFGLLPTLNFSSDSPFPTSGLTVNIATVKGGKLQTEALSVAVPTVNKW